MGRSVLMNRPAWRALTYELAGVAPGRRILDLGCGSGDDVFAMARQVGGDGEVVGVDLDETLIAEARRRAGSINLPIRFETAEATELPFSSDSFDGARAVNLLWGLQDPEAALAELVRVVRPGAAVVVADPDYGSAVLDVDGFEVAKKVHAFLCARIPNPWSGRRLKAMFRRAALTDILVHVEYRALTLADLEGEFSLSKALEAMVRQGLLDRDEATCFVRELEQRAEADTFFGGLSVFVVAGHKAMRDRA